MWKLCFLVVAILTHSVYGNPCAGVFGGRLVASPTSCNNFIVCLNDVSQGERPCPAGFNFDADNQVCRTAAETDCPDNICPATASPSAPVLVPSRTSCTRFFICVGPTSPLPNSCGPGNNFQPDTGECALGENSQCAVAPYTPPEFPPSFSSWCPPEGVLFLPNMDSCSWYFMCANGMAVMLHCAPPLQFDVTTRQCSATATCAQNQQVTCPNDPPVSNIPNPLSCNRFFLCVNGDPIPQTCSASTIFDTNTMRCELQETATCNALQ